MERKYQIVAAHVLVPMTVRFRKLDSEESEFVTVSVGVNYAQDQVVFNSERIEGVDYDDLEQEILAYLRPGTPSTPNIPADIMERVAKVRSGEYQAAFNPEFGR